LHCSVAGYANFTLNIDTGNAARRYHDTFFSQVRRTAVCSVPAAFNTKATENQTIAAQRAGTAPCG